MEHPLHYDFRDILPAPARALRAKKILVMTLFLLAGLAVYDVFAYLALALGSDSGGAVWKVHNLFPFIWFRFDTLFAEAIFILGIGAGLFMVMLGMFAVAAIDFEAMRGNPFFGWAASIRFAFRRASQIFFSELAIVAFLVFVALLFALLGLVSRIPWLGEWLYALAFVIPGFIIAMLALFALAVFQASFLVMPITAAAERNGEVFGSLVETFSVILRQPVRWIAFTAYGLVTAKLAGFVYAYFAYRSVQFMGWAGSLAGADTERQIRAGLGHLPLRSETVHELLNVFPGVDWGVNLARYSFGAGDSAAGFFMAGMLLVIFTSILGYMLAVVATAQAYSFAVIRFKKDGYRIEHEKPLFFEDENINEPGELPTAASSPPDMDPTP